MDIKIHDTFFESLDSRGLKCHFRRIYRMIGSIIQYRFDTDYRVGRQRSSAYGFLNTFFHRREEILRYRATYDFCCELIGFGQIAGR